MITKEEFVRFCNLYKKAINRNHQAYTIGIDLIEYDDVISGALSILMENIFGEYCDSISDYIFEQWDGTWWDKDKNEFKINNYEELYDFVVEGLK